MMAPGLVHLSRSHAVRYRLVECGTKATRGWAGRPAASGDCVGDAPDLSGGRARALAARPGLAFASAAIINLINPTVGLGLRRRGRRSPGM